MDAAQAMSWAAELSDALQHELDGAEAEYGVLRNLDAGGMLARVQARGEFLWRVSLLQQRLAAALSTPAPKPPGLAEALARVRALAERLAALDERNAALARRGLAVVSGWLAALQPSPAVYDRRGRPAHATAAAGGRR